MYGRGDESRLRKKVKAAVDTLGPRVTTADVAQHCYPDNYIGGCGSVNSRQYFYIRQALAQLCTCIGRASASSSRGARPLVWERRQ